MNTYIALLRGINVGGNNLVSMLSLKQILDRNGFKDVLTYIQSGNIIFRYENASTLNIAGIIKQIIRNEFSLNIEVVVITKTKWQTIINNKPQLWGLDTEWKHNLIVMLEPYDMVETVKAIGQLKPNIEFIESADGYIYQSLAKDMFGKTTTGKLAASPIYKQMTIRNFNTVMKLGSLTNQIK
ncbi:MAG: DUF1697 domain-containing protein [Candidatus Saccharimonadales bacterium]